MPNGPRAEPGGEGGAGEGREGAVAGGGGPACPGRRGRDGCAGRRWPGRDRRGQTVDGVDVAKEARGQGGALDGVALRLDLGLDLGHVDGGGTLGLAGFAAQAQVQCLVHVRPGGLGGCAQIGPIRGLRRIGRRGRRAAGWPGRWCRASLLARGWNEGHITPLALRQSPDPLHISTALPARCLPSPIQQRLEVPLLQTCSQPTTPYVLHVLPSLPHFPYPFPFFPSLSQTPPPSFLPGRNTCPHQPSALFLGRPASSLLEHVQVGQLDRRRRRSPLSTPPSGRISASRRARNVHHRDAQAGSRGSSRVEMCR